MNPEVTNRIEDLINNNRIVLFMKGTKTRPQCGFSKSVVEILSRLTSDFVTFDVLSDAEMREGIKEYSQWPTIPQLYVDREFIGGCDIVTDLYKTGELQGIMRIDTAHEAPSINFTKPALEALKGAAREQGDGECVRLSISADFEYGLSFDEPEPSDFSLDLGNDVKLLIDDISATRANGLTIDFVEDKLDSGFSFDNPNEANEVNDLSVEELHEWHKNGQDFLLLDVRPKAEWEQAHIKFAKRMEDMSQAELNKLDKDTTLVFQCHHGNRSKKVAESFRKKGFNKLYNLIGGVDAWAKNIDKKVPVY